MCSLHAALQKKTSYEIDVHEKTVGRVLHGTCEALGGRKRVPWLFASFRDFEPQEHVPRTSGRAHTCTQCSRGRPATESTKKDPRAEERKMPVCKKRPFGAQ